MRKLGALLGATMLLAGCMADGVETPEPMPTAATVEVVTLEEQAETVAPPEPKETPSASPMIRGLNGGEAPVIENWEEKLAIEADPALVDVMECEPASAHTIEQMDIHTPSYPGMVQVLVGEGAIEGEQWWIVAGHDPAERPEPKAWLTNQPGLPDAPGSWFGTGNYDGVRWDYERFVRAESAVERAKLCLGVN